jgi:hypothetical protein
MAEEAQRRGHNRSRWVRPVVFKLERLRYVVFDFGLSSRIILYYLNDSAARPQGDLPWFSRHFSARLK